MSLWAYGISPHGLALSSEQFWACTPREYAELRKQAERKAALLVDIYANLQTTLHNAHFKRADGKKFLPEDFSGKKASVTQNIGDKMARIRQMLTQSWLKNKGKNNGR